MRRMSVTCCLLAAITVIVHGQSPPMMPTPLQPIASDPAQRALRQARSALFDNLFGVAGHAMAPTIDSEATGTPPRVTNHSQMVVDELPASFADTILVGRITGIQTFESNDQRALYTEYTVQVEQVSSQQGQNAAPGASIVIEQTGGMLSLPNGKVLTHESKGLGTAFQSGGRYAFFLTYVAKAQCYKLTKAWSLSNGQATAMSADDLGRVSSGTSQFNGMPEAAFLAALKSLQVSPRRN